MINRFKSTQLPGKFVYDNVSYDDPVTLVIDGFFDFCGCGQPEECLRFIRNVLSMLADRPEYDSPKREDWNLRWYHLVGNAEMFVLYALTNVEIDGYNIIEHGGDVTGSWLTPQGQEFLEDLNRIKV